MLPKILWASDTPSLPTGYAQVSRNILLRLKLAGFNVEYFGFQQVLTQKIPSNIPITYPVHLPLFPTGNGPHAEFYGNKGSLEQILQTTKPNILAMLCDSFMIKWMIESKIHTKGDKKRIITPIENIKKEMGIKTLFYFPFDSDEVYEGAGDVIKEMDMRVAMSRFGQNVLKRDTGLDSFYIPHGVDTNIYRKLPIEIINKAKKENNLENKFVVGCVARNQSRKMLTRLLDAFKIFSENKDDVVLFMHCDPHDPQGYNLTQYTKQIKLNNIIFGINNLNNAPNEIYVNLIYNLFDIHVLPTCYHPETQISTNKGLKDIQDIEIGDEVFTSDGTFKKVDDIKSFEYNGDILEVNTSYNPPVKITPNHMVFGVKCKNRCSYTKKKIKSNTKERIELKRMDEFSIGDYLIVPRITKTKDRTHILFDKSYIRNQFGDTNRIHPNSKNIDLVEIDDDLMWLFGYYLAEGCILQRNNKPEGIVFSCSTKETEYTNKVKEIIKRKFYLKCHIHDSSRHRRTIRIYNSSIGRKFKELFGSGAKNKKIPEWMLYLPKEKQQYLIDGYFCGDGYKEEDKRNGSISHNIDTVSKKLAYFIRAILIRLGYIVSLKTQERESIVYRLRWTLTGSNRIGWMDDNNFYIRISSIKKKKYKGFVYDLSVSENHNYCNYWLGKNTGEGFGLPIIESMAVGIPNICTNYTTAKELLGGGRGILARWDDYVIGQLNTKRVLINMNSLVKNMDRLYYNNKLRKRLSMRGREFILKHYNWEKILRMWIELLQFGEIYESR